ncbi:MAG: hypothetical protein M9945_00345 [Aquamicrobium sp.]|uniref:hypothetical protein n=1 Tax=Aquamicrobium sp. TaxID=1872579 RepID=UPI00349F0033|nr:hypothetical protein [Aquamicrobium sp.]
MKPLRLVPLILVAALAACTTVTPEEQRRADEETCRSYGFTRKNDAFAECLQRVELDRRAARRASLQRDAWIYAPPPQVIVVRPRR